MPYMQRNFLSALPMRELEDLTAQYKVAHSGAGKRILSLGELGKDGALVRGKETEDTDTIIMMLEEVKSTPDSEDVRVECCIRCLQRSLSGSLSKRRKHFNGPKYAQASNCSLA